MAIQLEQRLITVDEYHKMAEAGILKAEDKVELLNGQIIKMSPIGSKHAACVEKINELLKPLLSGKAMVRSQNPVRMGELSEPEPDIAVVKNKANYYADGHPAAADVFLIIEVADSSLEKDRESKLSVYATAKVPEYWIINIEKREIEVYQSPFKERYRSKYTFFPEDKVELPFFKLFVSVCDMLA